MAQLPTGVRALPSQQVPAILASPHRVEMCTAGAMVQTPKREKVWLPIPAQYLLRVGNQLPTVNG